MKNFFPEIGPSKKRRKWPWILSIFTLALLLSFALLPQILSTGIGRSILAHRIAKGVGGVAHVEKLVLSWGDGQEVRGVTWIDEFGTIQVRIDQIASELSLWPFLWGGRDFGKTTITDWLLLLEPPSETRTIGKKSPKSAYPIRGTFLFEKGTVKARTPSGLIALLAKVEGKAQMTANQLIAHFVAMSGNGSLKLDYRASRPGRAAIDLKGEQISSKLVDFAIGRRAPRLRGRWEELVGPTFNIDLTKNSEAFGLDLLSSQFKLVVDGSINNATFSLNKPATLAAMVTPELVARNPFPPPEHAPPELAAPSDLFVRATKLSFPLASWKEATVEAAVNTSSILIVDTLLGSWSTPNLRVTATRSNPSQPLRVKGGFDFVTLFSQGGAEIDLEIDRWLEGRARASIEQLPSLWLVTLVPPMRTPAPFLGSLIDLKLHVDGSWPDGSGTLSFASDALTIDSVSFELQNGLLFDDPFSFTYLLPRIVQAYYMEPLFGETLIDEVDPVEVSIDRLLLSKGQFDIAGEAMCKRITGGKVPGDPDFALEKSLLTLSSRDLDLTTTLYLFDPPPFVGESTTVVATVREEGLALTAQSERIGMTAVGALDGKTLRVTKPLVVDLGEPTPGILSIAPFEIDLQAPNLNALTLSADLQLSSRALSKLQASASWNGPANEITASLSCEASDGGTLNGQGSIEGLMAHESVRWQAASSKGALASSEFPLAIWDEIWGNPLATALLGESLTLDAAWNFSQLGHARGTLSLSAASPLFSGAADLLFADTLSLQQPTQIHWSLTPEALEAIYPNAHFALSTPAPIELQMDSLEWPWSSANFFPQEIGAKATLCVGKTKYGPLRSPSSFTLNRFRGHLETQDLAQRLKVAADLLLVGKTRGGANIEARVENLFRLDGGIERAAFSTDGALEAKRLPLHPLLTLLPISEILDEQLLALLGEEASLSSEWNLERLNGPLALQLDASHSTLSLQGSFTAGRFFLTAPLSASLEVTPYLGRSVLGRINPLLGSALSSEEPIRLLLPADGVQLPLYPWSLLDLQVPHARLELGRVTLANEEAVAKLLSLFPSQREPIVHAWFTPQTASIASGLLSLDRMDALIGPSLHIATWGTINLPTEAANLNLAISGESLRTLLDLSAVSNGYYLIIPMTGRMGHLQVDWFRASAQIAALTAKSMGGRAEQFGRVLDAVTGSTQMRTQMPPQPTLPWN